MSIESALRKRFCAPAWGLLFEVANATGGRASRRADAIAMSLWPSRGLELHGIEIKSHRNDWLRELRDPAKAETIAAYCDRFWLVTEASVAKLEEIPPAWGWLEMSSTGTLKQRKEAKATEARPVSRLFLASLFRSLHEIGDGYVRRESIAEALAEQFRLGQERAEGREKTQLEQLQRDRDSLQEMLRCFEAATGQHLSRYNERHVAAKIRAADAVVDARRSLADAAANAERVAQAARAAMAALDEEHGEIIERASMARIG